VESGSLRTHARQSRIINFNSYDDMTSLPHVDVHVDKKLYNPSSFQPLTPHLISPQLGAVALAPAKPLGQVGITGEKRWMRMGKESLIKKKRKPTVECRREMRNAAQRCQAENKA